jgi:hypothetical protein
LFGDASGIAELGGDRRSSHLPGDREKINNEVEQINRVKVHLCSWIASPNQSLDADGHARGTRSLSYPPVTSQFAVKKSLDLCSF